jgi:flagellar basal body-associated protein FliL
MSDETKEAPASTEGAPAKKKGLPGMVWFGGLALVIVGAAYLAVEYAFPAPPQGSKTSAEKAKPQPKMYRDVQTLPPMLVNLAGTGGKRYLKLGIAIEYEASDVDVIKKRFDARRPSIQDGLIEILSSLTLDKVNDPESKGRLKELIAKSIVKIVFEDDTPVTSAAGSSHGEGGHEGSHESSAKTDSGEVVGKVTKILFTDFVVQ